jgi:hypothetical protein
MKLALLWVALSVATGWFATLRGRSGIAWFQIALVISPFIASAFLAVTGKRGQRPDGD